MSLHGVKVENFRVLNKPSFTRSNNLFRIFTYLLLFASVVFESSWTMRENTWKTKIGYWSCLIDLQNFFRIEIFGIVLIFQQKFRPVRQVRYWFLINRILNSWFKILYSLIEMILCTLVLIPSKFSKLKNYSRIKIIIQLGFFCSQWVSTCR